MYDYSMTENEQKYFILNYKKTKKGELKVDFADGTTIYLDDCPEHRKYLDQKLERQMAKVLEQQAGNNSIAGLMEEKSRQVKLMAFKGCGCAISSIAFLSIGLSKEFPTGLFVLSCSSFTLFYQSFKSSRENYKELAGKIEEIETFKYRNRHRLALEEACESSTAIHAVTPNLQKILLHEEDPFSAHNLEAFQQEDLRQILKASAQEKAKVKKLNFSKESRV